MTAPLAGLRHLAGSLLDLLLPPRCPVCEDLLTDPGQIICSACRFGFEAIDAPLCQRCALPLNQEKAHCAHCSIHPTGLDALRCGFAYGGSLQEAIMALKFGRRRELARPLAQLSLEAASGLPDEVEFLLPVPLHKTRFTQRGFDQAALIALELGRINGLPVLLGGLQRIRATDPQGQSRDQRARFSNVAGAFVAGKPRLIKDKAICLVDDVVTTGATMASCAGVLREAGASRITGFAVGRTLPDL
ncbi:MAG: ComF family protein [Deltaproteobacteria bacterium]|nr:ComF family protein [Deltaproteobacteria bacterium]